MDDNIIKLHQPFSMLVAGPQGARNSEFVKQLLSLKCYIKTNPSERIVWFYGRHQPDLLWSLAQEIPCIKFYEGFPMNIEVMLIEVNETFVSCRVQVEISWLKTSLLMEDI